MKLACRLLACMAFAGSALACGPVREGESQEGLISVGDEYTSAHDRLLAVGAFDITNLVHFYAGLSPYSVAKTKAGVIVVSSNLLVYTSHPSQEIRSWFLLPDNTCASVFVPQGNADRITAIELGERGKGFLPPAEALQPDNFSPAVQDPAAGDSEVEILEEEKPSGTGFWFSRIRRTVDPLQLDDPSDPRAKATTLMTGMPLRIASRILAAHGAEDISEHVARINTVEYVKGKYPRTIPVSRFYIVPGKTLVIVHALFDPLAMEQFTVEKLVIGAPGVGYLGVHAVESQKFTTPETLDLSELVRRAGPLHYAAQIGDLNAIKDFLQDARAAINDPDQDGRTPLHWTAKRGKVEAARALLRSGADVNAVDSAGDTPLILAARQGRPDLVALLLEHGARAGVLNHRKSSAFLAAGGRGDVATVALLLDRHQADPNQADEAGFTLLHRAAGNSNPGLTRVLLKHGADPNRCRSESISPLYEAVGAGAVEVTRLLLEAGADVQPNKDWRPMDAVAQSGSVEIARMLIARGAKPDGPALYTASNSGQAGVLKLFLENGADLHYTEEPWKRTALHTAHSAEVVKVLVQAGLDIEVRNDSGETPLHEAAHFAPLEVVVALLNLGADPRALSNVKKTPLQRAEDRDRPEKAEILQTLRAAMDKAAPKTSADKK